MKIKLLLVFLMSILLTSNVFAATSSTFLTIKNVRVFETGVMYIKATTNRACNYWWVPLTHPGRDILHKTILSAFYSGVNVHFGVYNNSPMPSGVVQGVSLLGSGCEIIFMEIK